jgi:hypothetical protein
MGTVVIDQKLIKLIDRALSMDDLYNDLTDDSKQAIYDALSCADGERVEVVRICADKLYSDAYYYSRAHGRAAIEEAKKIMTDSYRKLIWHLTQCGLNYNLFENYHNFIFTKNN